MVEKKYIVAKSDYHAVKKMERIYNRTQSSDTQMFDTVEAARKKIKSMALGAQELYSVFQVTHDTKRYRA